MQQIQDTHSVNKRGKNASFSALKEKYSLLSNLGVL
jgi:hypothetical protein